MLVDFGYAILDSLENEVSEMDNSVMGSGKFAAFILNFRVFTKAWLATYFDLPHSQLRNPKAVCNSNQVQLAFLMVKTHNSQLQPQLYYKNVPNLEF